MTKCEYCGKEITGSEFVRLDENCIKRVHVNCYLKKLFPDAKPGEIKVKRQTISSNKAKEALVDFVNSPDLFKKPEKFKRKLGAFERETLRNKSAQK